MEKKNIDWGNIGFGYIPTDYRYVSYFKNGAWDEGQLTTDSNIVLNFAVLCSTKGANWFPRHHCPPAR